MQILAILVICSPWSSDMNDIARHYNMDLPLLRIASGSRYELQTQMEISLNLQYSNRRELENLYALKLDSDMIGHMNIN